MRILHHLSLSLSFKYAKLVTHPFCLWDANFLDDRLFSFILRKFAAFSQDGLIQVSKEWLSGFDPLMQLMRIFAPNSLKLEFVTNTTYSIPLCGATVV